MLIGIQLSDPLLVIPFIAHSAAIKSQGHGEMQYFTSVFTPKYLHELDVIYYTLGKVN